MTHQRSQIFRRFARGQSICQVAESFGVSYAQAWSELRRAIMEFERNGSTARDIIRFQQYLILMRIVDQALAAFERSSEEGVREIATETIESTDARGNLRPTAKSVTRLIRKGGGDVRYLEVALKALGGIRDLFGIGAEAESKLRATVAEGSPTLQALTQTRALDNDALVRTRQGARAGLRADR